MNLSELLAMGIVASLDQDGSLHLDAPKGALTPDLLDQISQSKPGLVVEIEAQCEGCEVGELHPSMFTPERKGTPPADEHHRAWLIHFADRDPLEVRTAPPATHGEVLALYPGAVAAEPALDHIAMAANLIERDELLALIAAVYAADTDQDRQEAIGLALVDPAGALTCYRAIAAERGIVGPKVQVSKPVSMKTPVQACPSCRHLARPGRADGYCAESTDLQHAYGGDHPLRQLPADGGADCPKWAHYE